VSEEPILVIGESLMHGKFELYQDRLEYSLRTRHVSVPIDHISSIGTSGFGVRKLEVHTRGETLEIGLSDMDDYLLLQDGLRRIHSGERLGPNQLREEQYAAIRKGVRDFGGSVRQSLTDDVAQMRKAAEWGTWIAEYTSERWGWKGRVVGTIVALAVLALLFFPLWSTW
jgi:hypothetical protein